jgi:16S rRNA (cytidine1402-2'-O)-methyltransferase
MGRLYVVATPIGNLEDISLRAVRLLSEVGLIAAEDTRTARVFLQHHGLTLPLLSYTDHNQKQRIPQILQRLDQSDVALITDAGTPAISDPGVELVSAVRAAGHEVLAVPGASAVVAALSVAGLPSTSFHFVGFLPRAAGDLRRLLEDAAARADTLVAFESPARLRKSLAVMDEVLPDARLAVCRELTKLHEETFVGTPGEALRHFETPRGEIVVVIQPAQREHRTGAADEDELRSELKEMKRLGLTRAQATALLTRRLDVSRRRLYELWLEQ